MNLNNKIEVTAAINAGMPCYQRYGFRWKGAIARKISAEKALELLPQYSPGMGFWELRTENISGVESIVFNEYSEADMF